jgi:hypothetical protein
MPEPKIGVLFFHKNIYKICKEHWVDNCVKSVLNQNYKNFDLFEINYGGVYESIFDKFQDQIEENGHKHFFYAVDMETHTHAMNFLLNKCFHEMDYEIVFNTNMDDYYTPDRFEEQLYCIGQGYKVCSPMWIYFTEEVDFVEKEKLVFNPGLLAIKDTSEYINQEEMQEQLDKNNNVLNHSGVCWHRDFWNSYDIEGNLLRYRDDKPFEDLTLWRRASHAGIPMTIINKHLIQYRIHENQIVSNKQSEEDRLAAELKEGKISQNEYNRRLKKPSTAPKTIGFYFICTGQYTQFLQNIVQKVEEYVMPDYPKTYFIFSDDIPLVDRIMKYCDVKYFAKHIYAKGFPFDTLYRYKYLLMFEHELELLVDVIYYLDVDMDIISDVGKEILPDRHTPLVGTRHPGFYVNNCNGSPETREECTAYIAPSEYQQKYIAGGFNGGLTRYYLDMAKDIQSKIYLDKSKDLMAVWHDESQINRYFISNISKFKLLTPEYCFPESPYVQSLLKPGGITEGKIIALDKEHAKIRNFTKKTKKVSLDLSGSFETQLLQCIYALNEILQTETLKLYIKHELGPKNNFNSPYIYSCFDNIFRYESIDSNDEQISGKPCMDFRNFSKVRDFFCYENHIYKSTLDNQKRLNQNKYSLVSIDLLHNNLDISYYTKAIDILIPFSENIKNVILVGTPDEKCTSLKKRLFHYIMYSGLVNSESEIHFVEDYSEELRFFTLVNSDYIVGSETDTSVISTWMAPNAKRYILPANITKLYYNNKDNMPKDIPLTNYRLI